MFPIWSPGWKDGDLTSEAAPGSSSEKLSRSCPPWIECTTVDVVLWLFETVRCYSIYKAKWATGTTT